MSLILKSLLWLSFVASITFSAPIVVTSAGSDLTFTKTAKYTFTGTSLPDGLIASDGEFVNDQSNGAPYNHIYKGSNVIVRNGFAELRVPGRQTPASAPSQAVSAAQIFTREQNILYGSVRTKAILSKEPGTVQGLFFYKTDDQEVDIEILSDPSSIANRPERVAAIHYTNQGVDGGPSKTSHQALPADASTVVHEYRIDWTADYTAFYLDGLLKQKYTENVPSLAGTWLWNNWANGDVEWSAGPPAGDSVMKIQSIEMFYNTSTTN